VRRFWISSRVLISRKLLENAEWQMELLDESRKPVFRIRLVAETLQNTR
jgi:hypothetical protein